MRRGLLLALAASTCADQASPLVYAVRPVQLTAEARDLAVDDLDGDGRLDLVSIGGTGVAQRLWTDGHFGTATVRSLGDPPVGLALSDLDGDGRLDLAVGLPERSAIMWLPDLVGGLPPREIAIAAAVRNLVAGDIDGDGLVDLIAAVQDADELLLLRGGRDGPVMTQRLELDEPNALAVVDLDGDGRSEVAVSLPARGVVQMLTATSEGLLKPGAIAWQTPFPMALATADLNNDGDPDLAAVDALQRRVWVGVSDGEGGWKTSSQWTIDVEPASLLARHGPDGPELVVLGSDRRSLTLIDPRTGLTRARAAKNGNQLVLAAADLEGDGIDELVYGEGILRDKVGDILHSYGPPVGPATRALVRADLDGDGQEELIAEEPERSELVIYMPNGADLLELGRVLAPPGLVGIRPLARGDGGYDLAWWSQDALGVLFGDGLEKMSQMDLSGVVSVVPMYVNDDGIEDAAVVVHESAVSALEGAALVDSLLLTIRNGGSLFPTGLSYESERITDVVSLRADDDELDDVWIAHREGVTILRSGEGWAAEPAGALANLTGVQAVDLDEDGVLDLVGCDVGSKHGVFAAHGLGAGVLGPSIRLAEHVCTQIHACANKDNQPPLLALRRSTGSDFLSPYSFLASMEVLRLADGHWSSGGNLYPGLESDYLAMRCEPSGLSVWSGGGRGLALFDLRTGPALIEEGTDEGISPVLLGDVDGDGLDDLVTGDGPRVMLARGDDDRGFFPAVSFGRPTEAISGQIVGLGEFDGEPGAELVIAEYNLDGMTSHALWSLRGERFKRIHTLEAATWDALGDFDGDGRDELLTRDGNSPALIRPDAEPELLDGEHFLGLYELRVADMDGDGRTDLLAGTSAPSSPVPTDLYFLRSTGHGFAPAHKLPLVASLGLIGVGNFDNDDAYDLVAIEPLTGLTVCRRGSVGPAESCETTPWIAAPAINRPAVFEDLDEDGSPDLVLSWTTLSGGSFFQVLHGNGVGGLRPASAQTLHAGALRSAQLGGDRPSWVLLTDTQAFTLSTGRAP